MKPFGTLLLLVVVATAPACMVDARGERAEGTFSRTLDVSGPVQLEVETGSGEIDVRTADSGTVIVRGRVRAGWRFWDRDTAAERVKDVQQSPPIEQNGNAIHIGQWPRRDNISISYLVTVPKETSVRIRTGSGDVRVADLQGPVSAQSGSGEIRIGQIAGEVRARTGSGDVELEAGDGIDVDTGSGRVLVRGAGAGRARLSTGSGDIEVLDASGALRARTGSGSILVRGAPADAWNLSAGSGDVSIETTNDAAFDVDVRSSSGDIDARAVTTTERRTRNSMRGTVRGGGPLVSASTGSGEIRVR